MGQELDSLIDSTSGTLELEDGEHAVMPEDTEEENPSNTDTLPNGLIALQPNTGMMVKDTGTAVGATNVLIHPSPPPPSPLPAFINIPIPVMSASPGANIPIQPSSSPQASGPFAIPIGSPVTPHPSQIVVPPSHQSQHQQDEDGGIDDGDMVDDEDITDMVLMDDNESPPASVITGPVGPPPTPTGGPALPVPPPRSETPAQQEPLPTPAEPLKTGSTPSMPFSENLPALSNSQSDREVSFGAEMANWIQDRIKEKMVETGVDVLASPTVGDMNNPLHQAIHTMRWKSHNLPQMDIPLLLHYQAVLSAHQVYVGSQESYWEAKRHQIGEEYSRIILLKRDQPQYKADTKKESEEKCVMNEPNVRHLRHQFLYAQAMAMVLHGQGDRFAQFENGIKRAIDFAMAERNRTPRGI